MTEPENFEEDLFADLYADDEPAGKPSVPAVHSEPSPVAVPEVSQPAPDTSHASNSHGVGDTQMHEEYDEEEEDDDDVDFNLGDNSTGPKIATPSYHDAPAPAPAPAASAPPSNKGPNSKEDG